MTDRELLEMAAKAAKIDLKHCPDDNAEWVYLSGGKFVAWTPLTDDGDALRLAVKLRLRIEVNETSIVAQSLLNGKDFYEYPDDIQDENFNVIYSGHDRAVRRSIVRAAAEIGKGMP